VEYRQLGRSGLRISAMTLGTMGFGGGGVFADVGTGDVRDARRQIDLALEAGVNMVDTADVYSMGKTEEIVGQALGSRRDDVILATKARFPMGDGPNDAGLSRHHLVRACEASLRRLGTDYIDLYQLHEWDGQTPLEETLGALEHLLPSGKVRYVRCSNFAGWQVIKALGIARGGVAGLCQPAGLPVPAGALGRVRDRPLGARSGIGPAYLESAGRRPALGQIPPRPASARGLPARHRLGRAAGLRRERALGHRRRANRGC
jgi:aryl-alcohol dehydrogenase-like predicted oxidoreductase